MSFNPWMALAPNQSRTEQMKSLGLHVMKTEWAQAGLGSGRVFSTSLRQLTLKLQGSSEEMTIPVQTCTTVGDVRSMLAERLMILPEQLTFVYRQGCAWRVHLDMDQISSKVIVRGIPSFKPLPYEWPHPVGVIGAGYNGIKTGMRWLKDGSHNFVVFDRHDRVGGYCWLTAANKHSRLQSEFGAFHVWYGPEFNADTRCGGTPTPETWEVWPNRERVLWHLQHAAEEYGLLPHCHFSANVTDIDINGRKTDHGRWYKLTVAPASGDDDFQAICCGVISCPGVMTANRLVQYPGEDSFGGQIKYGMNDDVTYDQLAGSFVAILGNGAFAIENVRTCLEHGVKKVFLVTRQKNLVCPRLPCWFVHQATMPVPSGILLQQFEPMYALAGLENPFLYRSVHGQRDGPSVVISANSRFGIGDVIFLACAYGKLEFVEDQVKRFSRHTVHLEQGQKLKDVTNVIKALGLVGDFGVDKLHRLRQMAGIWCDGDYRRPLHIDAQGMDTANFEALSVGIGAYSWVQQDKFLFDYPKEYHRVADMGLTEMLPVNKAVEDKPCYCYDARYLTTATSVVLSMIPKILQLTVCIPKYKHDLMHKAHPLKEYLRVCREEWDSYQEVWKADGCNHDYVPYPYAEETVEAWKEMHKNSTEFRAVDDSVVPVRTKEQDREYHKASYDWWVSQSTEARWAWVVMKKGKRSASAF